MPPDLWLLFAPIKKARTDFIVEKAVELGVARIMPVQTRAHQFRAHPAGPAAGPRGRGGRAMRRDLRARGGRRWSRWTGCWRDWPADRRLLWCDEAPAGRRRRAGTGARGAPWAMLIGPEGGFSDGERARLRALPQVVPLALGPRILRADTAAVAALTLWQAALGDWA